MSQAQAGIRQRAAQLLAEKTVGLVLGYAPGSVPFRTVPAFVERPEDAERLVWNRFCSNNLAVYLPRLATKGRVAMVAKGCDARALTVLLQEHQVLRDKVMVLGVPCAGMVDVQALGWKVPLRDVREVSEVDGELVVALSSGERRIPLADVLLDECRACEHPAPPLADEILGEVVTLPAGEASLGAKSLVGSPDEQLAALREHLDRCLRCYACRAACPACYCKVCFADKAAPRWVSKANRPEETWMFHAGRAFHLAGRCVECGACERACPSHIPLTSLTRALGRMVRERFDHAAGLDPAAVPALGMFKDTDPEPGERH
jgi:ferredoxin